MPNNSKPTICASCSKPAPVSHRYEGMAEDAALCTDCFSRSLTPQPVEPVQEAWSAIMRPGSGE